MSATLNDPRIGNGMRAQFALRRARLMLVDGTAPHSVVTAWFPSEVADACPRLANEGPPRQRRAADVGAVMGDEQVRLILREVRHNL